MRLGVISFQQMFTHSFDPLRLDACNHAGEDSSGLEQTADNNPTLRFTGKWRAGRNYEARAACAEIFTLFVKNADMSQKTAENSLMQRRIIGGGFITRQPQLSDAVGQLRMQFLPFTHAD